MSSNVEQVKARLSVVDVVGSYIKLGRAGVNWKANCPFHSEKTPSFYVSPSRESWHCFGCDKGGDIISFVEEYEGVDFMGALKILADRAGFSLLFEGKGNKDEREELKIALELATSYYEALLSKKDDVRNYLRERGLSSDSIKKWRVGYAPMGWGHLKDALISRKVRPEMLVKAGLCAIKKGERAGERSIAEGDLYDRFRGRIMFPLMDPSGSVVGFSGRIAPGNTTDTEMGKYINTQETVLYNKSGFLYGYNFAKSMIREKRRAILVEGQMDIIMSHQAGVENAVAVSGTALTTNHVELLGRLADELVVAFDGDPAGERAAGRAFNMGMASKRRITVKAVTLQNGVDPADLARDDPTMWKKLTDESEHFVSFLISSVQRRSLSKEALRRAMDEEVIPYIAVIDSVIEQSKFVQDVALLIGEGDEIVWHRVRELAPKRDLPKGGSGTTVSRSISKTDEKIKSLRDRLLYIIRSAEEAKKEGGVDFLDIKKRLEEIMPGSTRDMNEMLPKDSLLNEVRMEDLGVSVAKIAEETLLQLEEELIGNEMANLLVLIKEGEHKLSDEGMANDLSAKQSQYYELLKRRSAIQEGRRLL